MAEVRFDPQRDSVYPQTWIDFPMSAPMPVQPAGATERGQAGAGAAPPPLGGHAYRDWLGAQAQTPDDILKNYWAPDWKEVFTTPSRWGASAPAAPAPSPFDIHAFGNDWVRSGGRSLQDWLNYYNSQPAAAQAGAKLSGSKQDKLEYGGRIYDMVQAAGMGGRGATFNDVTNPSPAMPASSYAAQFSDPSTQQLEQYVQELIAQLKQPPFTGQQQEVLRTQALEPIERDRSAAKYRALNNIGARGLDPSSGIAQELLNQVDRGFDTTRAQAQNDLAYRTIGQTRSNQNDVLSLLQLLYRLPRNAQQDALAVLGMGPNPSSLFNSYAQLGAMNASNSAASGQWLGQLLAYLLR